MNNNSRKYFALGLSVIATCITLASAAATYSVNLAGFQDWGAYTGRILALLTTIGIEATFGLVLYGISHAVTGAAEKSLSVITLAFLLGVMATNYTIHKQIVTGVSLSAWQTSYYQWAGSLTLFVIVVLIIAFRAVAYESRERQMNRDIASLAKRRGLEWTKETMESPELADYLDGYREHVFASVRRTLNLPIRAGGSLPASAEADRRVEGFARNAVGDGEKK